MKKDTLNTGTKDEEISARPQHFTFPVSLQLYPIQFLPNLPGPIPSYLIGGRILNIKYKHGAAGQALQCTLASKVTGYRIALSRPFTRSTYSLGGRKGVSVLEFNIDQPGIYEFSASYPEGQEGPEVVLAMGQGFLKNLMGTIVGGLAIFFGSGATAIAIAVVTVLKRQKARKQLERNYG